MTYVEGFVLAVPADRNAVFFADRLSSWAQATNFRRPRPRLWALFNRRYFEVSVAPILGWVEFAKGWYGQEQTYEGEWWRWMGSESHTSLGPIGSRATLAFHVTFPLDAEPAPAVTVKLDGAIIDHFVPKQAEVERSYVVASRTGAPDELVISVDHVVNFARLHRSGDTRDLGMQIHYILWKPAP